jgi:hypothetical protein
MIPNFLARQVLLSTYSVTEDKLTVVLLLLFLLLLFGGGGLLVAGTQMVPISGYLWLSLKTVAPN